VELFSDTDGGVGRASAEHKQSQYNDHNDQFASPAVQCIENSVHFDGYVFHFRSPVEFGLFSDTNGGVGGACTKDKERDHQDHKHCACCATVEHIGKQGQLFGKVSHCFLRFDLNI